ncbi:c-type cytochrome [Sulfurimonas sp.]|uniref:c-type cytochrome n=1 Tax=Sulfurimonas sp. TaxID=2022749 RepID=UPI002B4A73F7|nr:c-type cytochrome [Sulfurimonas sp.]
MRLIILTFLIFSSLLSSTSYEMGKKLYMQKACFSCHGIKAEGMHLYPRLANRAKGFLTYKLKKFRNKLSDNQQQEMMIAYAVGLSDEDIENLTTFMSNFVDDENQESYDDSYHTHGDGGS